MKILSGSFKNRSIVTPKEGTFRPSLGRTRAMVCNICQTDLEDAFFLDLFAATGAMGFEALSRGAKKAFFIDNNPHAATAMKQTAQHLGVEKISTILCRDVVDGLRWLIQKKEEFHIIFMDPPYFRKEHPEAFQKVSEAILLIDSSDCLKKGGTLFIEDSKKSPVESLELATLRLKSKRPCGDAFLWQFQKN